MSVSMVWCFSIRLCFQQYPSRNPGTKSGLTQKSMPLLSTLPCIITQKEMVLIPGPFKREKTFGRTVPMLLFSLVVDTKEVVSINYNFFWLSSTFTYSLIFVTYILMLKHCYCFLLNEQCQNNPLFICIVLLPSGLSHGTVTTVSGLLSCANQVFEPPLYV